MYAASAAQAPHVSSRVRAAKDRGLEAPGDGRGRPKRANNAETPSPRAAPTTMAGVRIQNRYCDHSQRSLVTRPKPQAPSSAIAPRRPIHDANLRIVLRNGQRV